MDAESPNVTQLLNAWNAGDENAGRELVDVVYKELRRLAGYYMRAERPDHTLQPTVLVHELYLKLFSSEPLECRDRGHLLAVAAKQLRNILVDHARGQRAQKRGGTQGKIALQDVPDPAVPWDGRVLDVDRALDRLAKLDARAAQVVELRYFGGLTDAEVGETLDISVATVKRDWEFARTWLLKEIE